MDRLDGFSIDAMKFLRDRVALTSWSDAGYIACFRECGLS